MKKMKELVLIIMERYAVAVEYICITVGEYMELTIADIVKFGKYLLAGLIVRCYGFYWQ